jgi:hypothetical protein
MAGQGKAAGFGAEKAREMAAASDPKRDPLGPPADEGQPTVSVHVDPKRDDPRERTVEYATDEQLVLTDEQKRYAGPPLLEKAEQVHRVSVGAEEPLYVDRWGTHPARTAGSAVAEGRGTDDGKGLAVKSDATGAERKDIERAQGVVPGPSDQSDDEVRAWIKARTPDLKL